MCLTDNLTTDKRKSSKSGGLHLLNEFMKASNSNKCDEKFFPAAHLDATNDGIEADGIKHER